MSTHLVFSVTQEVLLCDLFAELEKEGQRDEREYKIAFPSWNVHNNISRQSFPFAV